MFRQGASLQFFSPETQLQAIKMPWKETWPLQSGLVSAILTKIASKLSDMIFIHLIKGLIQFYFEKLKNGLPSKQNIF